MTFPVGPVEYGTYRWLRSQVGGYMAYGYDEATYDHNQSNAVDSIVQSGVMQFYFPPPIPMVGEKKPQHAGKEPEQPETSPPHQWSFLKPVTPLVLAAGTDTYDLPLDFGGMIGEFTGAGATISIVPEVQLRQLRSSSPRSDTPTICAVRPKRTDGTSIQRWEVVFYPSPSAETTLSYRYTVSPLPLSNENPYPLGGRQYAETILQSCLAVAESRFGANKDSASWNRFVDRLSASVQLDIVSLQPTEDSTWAIDNQASDLTVNKAYLKRLIGRLMGYGPNPGVWSTKQAQEVKLALETGLRNFYNPVLVITRNQHQWSFLIPVAQMQTVSGQYTYDLPVDFAMMEGPLTYARDAAVLRPSIPIVGEYQLRQRLQRSEASGRPTLAAVRPKPPGADGRTEYEMLLWPVPDEAYSILYRYRFNPMSLPEEVSLPHGGPAHAQTVIEACLSAAEEVMGKQGLHTKLFLERLAASISHDQQANSPSTLGYNADRGLMRRRGYGIDHHDLDENLVTYNGQVY